MSDWEKTWDRDDCETEVSVMHRCDWAIFRSGYRPDRLHIPADFREKAAKAEKYGSQFKEAMNG